VTPREEVLATGMLGPAGARLLYFAVQVVAIGRRFPPPAGSQVWDESAVADVAHDFLSGDRGQKRIADITIRSVDERSFERQLDSAVVNFLRDIARGTDFGKLVVRVKDVLRSNPEFRSCGRASDRWALVEGPDGPSEVEPDALKRAIAGSHVVVPKWTSERRNAPLADEDTFVRLIRSVLKAAKGSLTAVDISHALATRLDHRRTPLSLELDIGEAIAEPAEAGVDPADEAVSKLHAADIFNTLSERERIIVATLGSSVRQMAAALDIGKSQAALIRQRLFDKLAVELDDPESAELTSVALTGLCTHWLEKRTSHADPTS
jgi:hypothetical protein